MGNDLLTLRTTSVAVAASLSAVLLAVDQLTSGVRLRSLEGILRAAQECPDGPERDAVVASIRRATLAKIIARDAVPLRTFLLPFIILGVSLAFPLQAGLRLGLGNMDPFTFVALTVGPLWVMWQPLQELVRKVSERVRVARCYRKGITPVTAHLEILAVMEGGTRREFWLCELAAVGLVDIAAAIGVLWRLAGVKTAEVPLHAALWMLAVLVGILVVAFCVESLRNMVMQDKTDEPDNRDHSLSPTWVHPDPTDQSPTP